MKRALFFLFLFVFSSSLIAFPTEWRFEGGGRYLFLSGKGREVMQLPPKQDKEEKQGEENPLKPRFSSAIEQVSSDTIAPSIHPSNFACEVAFEGGAREASWGYRMEGYFLSQSSDLGGYQCLNQELFSSTFGKRSLSLQEENPKWSGGQVFYLSTYLAWFGRIGVKERATLGVVMGIAYNDLYHYAETSYPIPHQEGEARSPFSEGILREESAIHGIGVLLGLTGSMDLLGGLKIEVGGDFSSITGKHQLYHEAIFRRDLFPEIALRASLTRKERGGVTLLRGRIGLAYAHVASPFLLHLLTGVEMMRLNVLKPTARTLLHQEKPFSYRGHALYIGTRLAF